MADGGTKKAKGKKQSASGRKSVKDNKDAVEEKRQNLKSSIRSQVSAEQKAHEIVERLVMEDDITQEYFLEIGNYITPTHYSDVVIERSISKVCGFPICSNPLTVVLQQKYKISTRRNRVYDITERKCFCSSFCFKASKYYESQIPISPVWTRIGEQPKKFALLQDNDTSFSTLPNKDDDGGSHGNTSNNREDVQNKPVESRSKGECVTHAGIHDATHGVTQYVSDQTPLDELICQVDRVTITTSILSKENPNAIGNRTELEDTKTTNRTSLTELQKKGASIVIQKELPCHGSHNQASSNLVNTTEQFNTNSSTATSVTKVQPEVSTKELFLLSVQEILNMWFTQSTLEFLGINKKDRRKRKERTDDGEDKDDDEEEEQLNSLTFAEKALQFLKPTNYEDDDDDDVDDDKGLDNNSGASEDITINDDSTQSYVVVPPIESQVAIRRRIVLQMLAQVLPDILNDLGLTVTELSTDLTDLVRTFRLDSRNTMVKPLQWTLLAVSLVYLLRNRNELVHKGLITSKHRQEALTNRVGLTQQELATFINCVEGEQFHREWKQSTNKERDEENIEEQKESNVFSHMEDLD